MTESRREHAGEVVAGRYELADVIGQGGLGLVWRARDRDTGRDVAVKMLSEVAARDPQQIERLRREQLALVALAGTSAVGFLDLCSSKSGRLCLVLELLDGIDLEQRIEQLESLRQKMSLAELVSVLGPIVTTLDRAHRAGIIHRDLKPANIFLVAERAGGGVRLLDFGLARLRSAQPLTAAGMIVGSPSYIAPEIWRGTRDLDGRVDIYSFGVLVFRLLSGQLPFEGATLQDKFTGATSSARPSLRAISSDLPEEVDDWVQQVLAADRERRFRTIRGAWNALLAALGATELAAELVSDEDFAIASKAEAALRQLTKLESPEPAKPSGMGRVARAVLGTVRKLAQAVQTPLPAAPKPAPEKSVMTEWLAQSDYEPPAEEPPSPSLRGARVIAVGPDESPDTQPSPVAPQPSPLDPGQAGATGEKSLVSQWLSQTAPVEPAAPDDVMAWLGAGTHRDNPATHLKTERGLGLTPPPEPPGKKTKKKAVAKKKAKAPAKRKAKAKASKKKAKAKAPKKKAKAPAKRKAKAKAPKKKAKAPAKKKASAKASNKRKKRSRQGGRQS